MSYTFTVSAVYFLNIIAPFQVILSLHCWEFFFSLWYLFPLLILYVFHQIEPTNRVIGDRDC